VLGLVVTRTGRTHRRRDRDLRADGRALRVAAERQQSDDDAGDGERTEQSDKERENAKRPFAVASAASAAAQPERPS